MSLLVTAPFIPDEQEEVIKGWINKSAETALLAGLSSAAAGLFHGIYFNHITDGETSASQRRMIEAINDCAIETNDTCRYDAYASLEIDPEPEDATSFFKSVEIPKICQDCANLNSDFSTREYLTCAVVPILENPTQCSHRTPTQA
jgi:hypothetical protein